MMLVIDANEITYHIIDGKDARTTLQLTAPPVFIAAVDNLDDITFFKSQFSGFRRFECM